LPHKRRVRGQVEVGGEIIGYELYEIDSRTAGKQTEDGPRKVLDGNLNVYIPGHGQTVAAARNLMATIVALSSSKMLWSIDIDPPKAGDPARAEALLKIIRKRVIEELFVGHQKSVIPSPFRVTIFGWSHGAAEALRAAEKEPRLFSQVVGICPAGLIERSLSELTTSFLFESLLVFLNALSRFDRTVARVLAIGYDILAGIVRDLLRSKSLQRVLDDIRWACRKVTGKDFEYDGTVVILFAEQDSVMRWRDVFPRCQHPGKIDRFSEEYRRNNFPVVHRLEIRVLEGNHMTPEINASLYIRTAFDLLHRECNHPTA